MVSKQEYLDYVNSLISQEDKKNFNKKNNKKIAKILYIISGISFVVFAIILLVSILSKNFTMITILYVLFTFGSIILIFAVFCNYSSVSMLIKLENKYKEPIINFLLKDYNFSYFKEDFIDSSYLIKSQFCSKYIDKYLGEDKLVLNIPNDDGTKSSNNLVISDVLAIKETEDSEGKKQTETLYKGAFGYVRFPFNFKSTLTINTVFKASKPLQKVKLEDIKFNKSLHVLCDDQIEARYILTPEVMQHLLNLKAKVGNFKLVLDKNYLFIGFPYKNLFSLKKNVELIDAANFYDIYLDVYALAEIVKEIQTNNKVFKI